ncbi:hypothetical protein [Pedobacter frigiditerrae]|uniref:hypothetical protein n=1 Tax=Pedobacter frigiditerrae TaxID=2530452 RepID=UPI00292D2A2C|nr:hypothetical protein [Pedobacter frigiditerrae]
MAIQKGIIQLSGKLVDLIFYQRKNKTVVRRVKKDGTLYKRSEGSIQSGKDFGEASKNARYIRKAFAPLVEKYADDDIVNRLNIKLIDVFKTIPIENRGSKKLVDGNISLLKGFEFNRHTCLDRLYYSPPMVTIKPNGKLSLILTEGEMDSLFAKNKKFPNVCLNLMVFGFDLNGDDYEIFRVNELRLPLDEVFAGGNITDLQTNQTGERVLLIALGAHYSNGSSRSYDRKKYACQIINAYHLKDGVIIPFNTTPAEVKSIDEEEDTGLDWEIG